MTGRFWCLSPIHHHEFWLFAWDLTGSLISSFVLLQAWGRGNERGIRLDAPAPPLSLERVVEVFRGQLAFCVPGSRLETTRCCRAPPQVFHIQGAHTHLACPHTSFRSSSPQRISLRSVSRACQSAPAVQCITHVISDVRIEVDWRVPIFRVLPDVLRVDPPIQGKLDLVANEDLPLLILHKEKQRDTLFNDGIMTQITKLYFESAINMLRIED